jgi:hypothetical protein
MDSRPVRVVFEKLPYLVVRTDDGDTERAYGPFAPGTEPSLSQCGPEAEVRDPDLLRALGARAAMSPPLPSSEDTLAGG